MPFFSIILPTYNRAHLLSSAIESVLAQKFEEWELIVVDDGSTDNTEQVVRTYTDERVRYIYQKNSERSAARNNGILLAKGKFVCFLDSDDKYLSNHLSSFYEAIHNSQNDDAIFYSEVCIMENGKIIQQKLEVNTNENLQTFFFRSSIIPDRICIKKDILYKFQFDPTITISEDTDLLVRIACEIPNFIPSNSFSVLYNLHDENSVNFKRSNPYSRRKETLKKLLNKVGVEGIDRTVARKTINDCNWGIFKHFSYQNKRLMAWWIICLSFIEYPRYRTKEKIYLILTSLFARKNG